jgi:hypothetical protein
MTAAVPGDVQWRDIMAQFLHRLRQIDHCHPRVLRLLRQSILDWAGIEFRQSREGNASRSRGLETNTSDRQCRSLRRLYPKPDGICVQLGRRDVPICTTGLLDKRTITRYERLGFHGQSACQPGQICARFRSESLIVNVLSHANAAAAALLVRVILVTRATE